MSFTAPDVESRNRSGRAASKIIDVLFEKIITTLRRDRRFADISNLEFDLLVADVRNDAERILFRELRNRVPVEDVDDAICWPWG
jgi:hypothetical protein